MFKKTPNYQQYKMLKFNIEDKKVIQNLFGSADFTIQGLMRC